MHYLLLLLLLTVNFAGAFSAANAQELLARPKIIEFYAESCSNCNLVKPALQKMKKKYQDRIDVVEIDIADPANKTIVRSYPILALPTLVFQKSNGNFSTIYGYNNDEEIAHGTRNMLK